MYKIDKQRDILYSTGNHSHYLTITLDGIWSLFFYFFISFNFTILYWFCHISKWIRHKYTCVPHPEPSSFLPPHTIPLGHPVPVHQPQASSILHWTWTGNSFHIWYYTCLNAILPNHPTLSLSHRVQKTVLYISVSPIKKEHIWVSSNEVDETRAYYTEWSKPERKTPIQYTNACIWNLERW